MRTTLFFIVLSASFSAHAFPLKTHFGRLYQSGFRYYCTYRNNHDHPQNMKYVAYDILYNSDDNGGHLEERRIDRIVLPGETITLSDDIIRVYDVRNCRLLER